MRILVIIPMAAPPDDVAMRYEDLPEGLLDPRTEVEFRAAHFGGKAADSWYDLSLMETGALEGALGAEEEGFHAVCIGSVSDAGLFPLRSRLSIPVVGPGLVGYHVASMLGSRLSIIATSSAWRHFYVKNARLYGMADMLASVRTLDLPFVWDGFYDEGAADKIAATVEAGRQAVEHDGADVLMVGSTSMARAVPALREACGVPVIDPQPIALKMAEALVRTGLAQSELLFAASEFDQDAVLHGFAGSGS
jgi:allantoin racemase